VDGARTGGGRAPPEIVEKLREVQRAIPLALPRQKTLPFLTNHDHRRLVTEPPHMGRPRQAAQLVRRAPSPCGNTFPLLRRGVGLENPRPTSTCPAHTIMPWDASKGGGFHGTREPLVLVCFRRVPSQHAAQRPIPGRCCPLPDSDHARMARRRSLTVSLQLRPRAAGCLPSCRSTRDQRFLVYQSSAANRSAVSLALADTAPNALTAISVATVDRRWQPPPRSLSLPPATLVGVVEGVCFRSAEPVTAWSRAAILTQGR